MFLLALMSPSARADGPDLSAQRLLESWKGEDPGMRMVAEVAAAELDEALIVNPHETDAVAAALKRALEMPLDERRERHALMLAHLSKNVIKRWSGSNASPLRVRSVSRETRWRWTLNAFWPAA